MLCVEDAIDALNWIQSIGGSKGSIDKSQSNLQVVKTWVESKDWIDFLAKDSLTLSSTSICLKITDPWFLELPEDQQQLKIKEINSLLDKEQVAFDINAYRTAPPGFRIWGGATVESSDIETLLPWIEWGYQSIKE
jgi:phosphoserine aminotransferase